MGLVPQKQEGLESLGLMSQKQEGLKSLGVGAPKSKIGVLEK